MLIALHLVLETAMDGRSRLTLRCHKNDEWVEKNKQETLHAVPPPPAAYSPVNTYLSLAENMCLQCLLGLYSARQFKDMK